MPKFKTWQRYARRRVVVEAVRYMGGITEELSQFIDAYKGERNVIFRPGRMIINTLEGEMTADPGDWIIRGVAGEIYPCKPDIFARIYLPVEEEKKDKDRLRGLKFHIESQDYFGTLATVLSMLDVTEFERPILERIVGDLINLQQNYKIVDKFR